MSISWVSKTGDVTEKFEIVGDQKNHAKICEILKNIYLCMSPMTKMYTRIIELLMKSQVGLYLKKNNHDLKQLGSEHLRTMDDCCKNCKDYDKLDMNRDSFFAYLCTGKTPDASFFCRKYIHQSKKDIRRQQRNSRNKTTIDKPTEKLKDPATAFIEWKDKTQKMFNIFEFLVSKREELEHIVHTVDPLRRTCLHSLFRNKELDRRQKLVKELSSHLQRLDIGDICTCECLKSIVEQRCSGIKDVCKLCCVCGQEVSDAKDEKTALVKTNPDGDEENLLPGGVGGTTSKENSISISEKSFEEEEGGGEVDNNKGSITEEEELVDCQFVIRLSNNDENEEEEERDKNSITSTALINLLSTKGVDCEWDYSYSEVKVDYGETSTNISVKNSSGNSLSNSKVAESVCSFISEMAKNKLGTKGINKIDVKCLNSSMQEFFSNSMGGNKSGVKVEAKVKVKIVGNEDSNNTNDKSESILQSTSTSIQIEEVKEKKKDDEPTSSTSDSKEECDSDTDTDIDNTEDEYATFGTQDFYDYDDSNDYINTVLVQDKACQTLETLDCSKIDTIDEKDVRLSRTRKCRIRERKITTKIYHNREDRDA